MGRKRTSNVDLPPGLYRKRGRYYLGRQMEAVGPDLTTALRAWAARYGEEVPQKTTFVDASRHYLVHAIDKVAPKTRTEYERQLVRLNAVFGGMNLHEIQPHHIYNYLARSAPISGTREKALFSVIFNHARNHGLTSVPNPAQGIRGTKSRSRVYVTDHELTTVMLHADPQTAAFLELCWRTGADASVVLSWTPQDLDGDVLTFLRPKTGQSVSIAVTQELRTLRRHLPFPFTLAAVRKRFWGACRRANVRFSIRQLRAKAASDAAAAGSIQHAQSLLGHASVSTTAIYIRSTGQKSNPVTRLLSREPQ